MPESSSRSFEAEIYEGAKLIQYLHERNTRTAFDGRLLKPLISGFWFCFVGCAVRLCCIYFFF